MWGGGAWGRLADVDPVVREAHTRPAHRGEGIPPEEEGVDAGRAVALSLGQVKEGGVKGPQVSDSVLGAIPGSHHPNRTAAPGGSGHCLHSCIPAAG